MLNAEMSASALASAVEVDVKSVTRWIGEGRVPYPLTRVKVARILGQPETFLWPSVVDAELELDSRLAELQRVWSTRSAVSTESWHHLFARATAELDILVYAGGFLLETLDLLDLLRVKASAGTRVRVLIGDPGSEAVRIRAEEISLPWLPARCETTAQYLDAVRCEPGVHVRRHRTTLYASIFRFDDVLLANTHAYGVWAALSPALQLRRASDSGLFDFYAAAFERVWASSAARDTERSVSSTSSSNAPSLPRTHLLQATLSNYF